MPFTDDVRAAVSSILSRPWQPRTGIVVPQVDQVALSGEIVEIEASVLFADLAHSTYLVRGHMPRFAADVVRVFLDVGTRVIRRNQGEIRSFDGDRVMGVFIGGGHTERAARSALQLHGFMQYEAIPQITRSWTYTTDYRVQYGCGIDAGTLRVMRAGIRQNNDLVFMGAATNTAAKLSQERSTGYTIHITASVLSSLSGTNLLVTTDGAQVWHRVNSATERFAETIYATSCEIHD